MDCAITCNVGGLRLPHAADPRISKRQADAELMRLGQVGYARPALAGLIGAGDLDRRGLILMVPRRGHIPGGLWPQRRESHEWGACGIAQAWSS